MISKPNIAIVGAGRLSGALAKELRRVGYRIDELISREGSRSRNARMLAKATQARLVTVKTARLDADVIWLCVPDREIAKVGRKLAVRTQWKDKIVLHSSGALSSDELNVLRKKGAAIASVHPLMTFVRGSIPLLRGVPFGVEGDIAAARIARRIVKDLGGKAFAVRKKDKIAYHTWATFCSPLLIASLATAEAVGRAAGFSTTDVHRKMLPIVQQTVANYAALGAAGAFSGPIVRGDAEIVSQQLKVLRKIPEAREAYLALAWAAMQYLPVRNRAKLRAILTR